MLFNSLQFLIFFPIVVGVYFIVPLKYRYVWLFVASYYFYMCWNVKYVLLLLFSTVITYLSGFFLQKISDGEESVQGKELKRRLCVAASFVLNLGVLFWFKYFEFAVQNINHVLERLHITLLNPSFDIILPVGISFYTFQALSYTMDVYRGEIRAERNFIKYALFVSFFPQLVAGPIERSKNLLRQVNEEHRFSERRFCDGVYLMIWGYFLKLVVADRIALFVDRVYGDIVQFGGVYLITATVLFAFQIYCDFAGYSTIAMGAAEILGFDLMDNFNAPYFSGSVAEFWNRWHISLSSWFRDYLYIPLGGNRNGSVRRMFNLFVVFLVSGLWHGAEWSFVIWGLLHAVFQIVGNITKKFRDRLADIFWLRRDSFGHKIVKILLTFICVDFAWIFFRAETIRQAINVIKAMIQSFNPWVLFDESLYALVVSRNNFRMIIFGIFVLLVADYLKYKGICVRKKLQEQSFLFRMVVLAGTIWMIFVVGIWGPNYIDTSFIYFQF